MKWIKNYRLYKESKNNEYKDLVSEICISMLLINDNFLDNILDKGMKARYTNNSDIFITDIKNLLLEDNRLKLGKFDNSKFKEDKESSKINSVFRNVDFDIERDWNVLKNARNVARTIKDKILPGEKLEENLIKLVYWLGPNKTKNIEEDIVIELNNGEQFSIFLNKKFSSSKTSSFSSFARDLIGEDIDKLYKSYLPQWDKLIQNWIKLIYENANKNIKLIIKRFINVKRIDTIDYYEYFNITHPDPRYKNLGEYFEEFDKNILKFSELLKEVWKEKERFFLDWEKVEDEWIEIKTILLNSKILENLLTTSLKSNHPDDIIKTQEGLKMAKSGVKMKLFKLIIEKLGSYERDVYYVDKKGEEFVLIPSKDFFRKNYENLDLYFDYHVSYDQYNTIEETDGDFNIKIKIELDEETILNMRIKIGFQGGEISNKLSAKYKFDLNDNFNYLVSKKILD